MDTTELNFRDKSSFQRRDAENSNGREGRTFKCRQCGGFDHYQAECPTFLRKQKKSFSSTISDEENDASKKKDEFTNAFISKMTEDDSITDNKELEVEKENFPSYEQLQLKWEEDSTARTVHKRKFKSFSKKINIFYMLFPL